MFEHVLSREVAQERYSQKLKARSRQTSTLAGYRCLCCKDTALVSPEVVRRYQLSEGMLGVYDSYVMGDVAFLCRKVLCEANQVEVTMTDGSTKFVAKYSNYAVDTETISADLCDWLHKQEWDRIRAIDEQTMRSAAVAPTPIAPPAQKSDRIIETAIASTTQTSSQLGQIKPLSEVLPSLASLGHPESFKGVLEPENEIIEAEGFRVGDRVIPIAPFIGDSKDADRYAEAQAAIAGFTRDNGLKLEHPKTIGWAIATAKKMGYLCPIKHFCDIPVEVLEQMGRDGEARMIQKIMESKSA